MKEHFIISYCIFIRYFLKTALIETSKVEYGAIKLQNKLINIMKITKNKITLVDNVEQTIIILMNAVYFKV